MQTYSRYVPVLALRQLNFKKFGTISANHVHNDTNSAHYKHNVITSAHHIHDVTRSAYRIPNGTSSVHPTNIVTILTIQTHNVNCGITYISLPAQPITWITVQAQPLHARRQCWRTQQELAEPSTTRGGQLSSFLRMRWSFGEISGKRDREESIGRVWYFLSQVTVVSPCGDSQSRQLSWFFFIPRDLRNPWKWPC